MSKAESTKVQKKNIPLKKRKAQKRKLNVCEDESDSNIPTDPEIKALIDTIGKEKRIELENRVELNFAVKSKDNSIGDNRQVSNVENAAKKNF